MRWLQRQVSCQQLVELASDYIDGTLSNRVRRAVERHLLTCPNCPTYIEQLRLTIALTGGLRTDDVAPELLDVLDRAWRDAHRPDHETQDPPAEHG